MKFIKIIDRYIVSQFAQPFLAAFLIALLVLVMQFFWVYIDDIMGKGIGFFMIAEMVTYMSISLIPMALPIAILLSSVMLFGNLGERYELACMKSSGISLFRILAPIIIFSIAVAGFSFYCSNNLIPVSNLKFYSKLHDIRKHQPTFAMEPGVFNYDFSGYTVRIGERMPNGRGIKNVIIYDNSDIRSGMLKMIRADSGEMFMSGDQQHLVMRLFNGSQYQDLKEDGSSFKPFLETFFNEYQLVFDLSGFELERTDEERFKSHRRMLTVGQLTESVDSMVNSMEYSTAKVLDPFLPSDQMENKNQQIDTTDISPVKVNKSPNSVTKNPAEDPGRFTPEKRKTLERETGWKLPDSSAVDTGTLHNFIDFFPKNDHKKIYSQAIGFIQTYNLQLSAATQSLSSTAQEIRKQIYEKHRKFAYAAICIVFLFIGAPMGAIIRKGGYGYPLLVSILFFTGYVVLFTVFKEMNDARTLGPVVAAWLSEIILFPFGVFLTFQAMRDRKIVDIAGFKNLFARLFLWKGK
nr:LptF/LptG family permease [Saprospiraceae bacterium]